jgi:hypothetical protein
LEFFSCWSEALFSESFALRDCHASLLATTFLTTILPACSRYSSLNFYEYEKC